MKNILLLLFLAFLPMTLAAGEDPREVRHEMMEGVKDAAGVIGGMMKGETAFDQEAVMESLAVFQHAANEFGALFPDGTQKGSDALPSVWTDRDGFNAALADFGSAVEAAIAARPQDLEATKAAAGPVFKQCKACHKEYRADD